jgi:DNA-binding NtrC family response regulator
MGYAQSREVAGVEGTASVRTAVIATADLDRRQRIAERMREMRWDVRVTGGGAEALSMLDEEPSEVLILGDWLPDLEVTELATLMRSLYPSMDQLRMDEGFASAEVRSPRRNEVLLAVREATSAESCVLAELDGAAVGGPSDGGEREQSSKRLPIWSEASLAAGGHSGMDAEVSGLVGVSAPRRPVAALPEMVGESAEMQELAWLVRLVAPRTTTVLIEGPTGSGKELVAKAVHRLSPRALKPFVVLNCAAIPEALLEAELFGHTRGAFTGAVQSRVGRVEAAHGGTLFLDEIGEMPLGLQAKMLRFLECGEIQRVGGNETMRVDVRIVAATHQPLKQRCAENAFRMDLYHRLAVFPVHVPALRDRMGDVPALTRYLLERLGEKHAIKRLSRGAEHRLMQHDWPGNIRELGHVLERATILSEDRPEITEREIRL